MSSREGYERFVRDRHRPSHARRTADSHAAFFLQHVRPGMRVVDLGCGPASITTGLGDHAIGVDLDPGPASVPLARADISALPFPDASLDGVFCCAVMQHLTDPLAVLCEARRICKPGAVIGVADADWGGALRFPDDPTLERGQEILRLLRNGSDPYIGRRLRNLLHDAGFVRVTADSKGLRRRRRDLDCTASGLPGGGLRGAGDDPSRRR